MNDETWRNVWPPYRVRLIDESARCFVDQESAITGGRRSCWGELTIAEQTNATEYVARVFAAQDQALHNIWADVEEHPLVGEDSRLTRLKNYLYTGINRVSEWATSLSAKRRDNA